MRWRETQATRRKALILAVGAITSGVLLLSRPSDPPPEMIDQINAMGNSTFIACDGDIGPAVNTALSNMDQMLIGAGACTSSVAWDSTGIGRVIIHGMGTGVTRVTFTHTTGCAFEGHPRDTSQSSIAHLTFIIENPNVDGLCIRGLSNTSVLHSIETRGGRDHIRFTAAESDDSAMWVGSVVDWISIDAGRHALYCCDRDGVMGSMRGQFLRTRIVNPGGTAIRLHRMRQLSGGPSFVDTEIETSQNLVVDITTTSNTINRVGFLGGSTQIGSGQTFIRTDGGGTPDAFTIIDHLVPGTCGLLIDRPGTADDVPCSATERQVVPDGAGGDAVTNMNEGDRAIWRKWQRTFLRAAVPATYWWHLAENPDGMAEFQCSGNVDIGPDVVSALAEGKDIFLYNGAAPPSGTRGHCVSSVPWTVASGQKIIGMSAGVPNAGDLKGVWVRFNGDISGSCGITAHGNAEISRFKVGVHGTGSDNKDVICTVGFTGKLYQMDTRSGRNHIVLKPDADGVVADGVIFQLLNFAKNGCTIKTEGANSKTRLTLVGMDIGRRPFPVLCFDGMDPTTSAVAILGHQFHLGGSDGNLLMDVTGSGETPVLLFGASPGTFTTAARIVVADSDLRVTAVNNSIRSNPTLDIVCDLLVDKPGTANDVSCGFNPQSHIDLVDFTE